MKGIIFIKYEELIASSSSAFGVGQYAEALEFAKVAITINEKEVEAYSWAGKACMSLDMPKEATEYFTKAVSIDKSNGNMYFLLGYAQALDNNTALALKSLTKALENNCDDAFRGQLYKIIAMINRETGEYKNALINLDQAERFLDLDYELLQQRAACYAGLKDYHQTIYTLNQMKLLQPSDYQAYKGHRHHAAAGVHGPLLAQPDRPGNGLRGQAAGIPLQERDRG